MLRLRVIAVALAAAGVGVMTAACGSSLASGFAGPGGDAGTSLDSGGSEDSAAGDTGLITTSDAAGFSDGGDSGAVETGALFVHASPDLPDLRLCWKVGTGSFSADLPYPTGTPAPLSNYPAVPVGGGVGLPDASGLVGSDLTIVGIPANALAQLEANDPHTYGCNARLASSGAGSLHGITNVYTFTAPGGIVAGATNVIALAGCPAGDPVGSVPRCSAGYSAATGNLHVDVVPLHEITTGFPNQIAVQAAQLSPALAQLTGDAGAVVISYGAQGATSPVTTLTGEGAFGPTLAATVDAGPNPTDYGTLGFAVDVAGTDGGPGHLWMSLEQSLELVDPMKNPADYYASPTTYVVMVVGDPASAHAFAPDAAFDGTGLHILVQPLP